MPCLRGCRKPVATQPAEPRAAPVSGAYRVEAWIARLLFGIYGLLPLDRASALAGAITRRIGPLLGLSKRARVNLHAVLPELSDAQIEAIVRGMWDNLGRV